MNQRVPTPPPEQVLDDAIAQGATPGAQLAFAQFGPHGWSRRIHCAGVLGRGPYAHPVTPETRYDLASVTKVFTTLAVHRTLLERGLGPSAPLCAWTAARSDLGAMSTVRLLAHQSGLPAWVALFREVDPEEARLGAAYEQVVSRAWSLPREDNGDQQRYSDPGFIVLGDALTHAWRAPLSDVIHHLVTDPLGVSTLGFRSVGGGGHPRGIAPTQVCPWRMRLLCGEVDDENAYAMGGVAGHAGLFGDAGTVLQFGTSVLDVLAGRDDSYPRDALLNSLLHRDGGSHRAGWDGVSRVGSSTGRRMSPETFGHLGFTGTSIWCDPVQQSVVVLLTNRVHPTRENPAIRTLRPLVHNSVMKWWREAALGTGGSREGG